MKTIYKVLILIGAVLALLVGGHFVLSATSDGYNDFIGLGPKLSKEEKEKLEVFSSSDGEVNTDFLGQFVYGARVRIQAYGNKGNFKNEYQKEDNESFVRIYNALFHKNDEEFKLYEGLGMHRKIITKIDVENKEALYQLLDGYLTFYFNEYNGSDNENQKTISMNYYNEYAVKYPEYFELDREILKTKLPKTLGTVIEK